MIESLNVIALISGGKDSFYSVLHCLRHGHKVVAFGNLHPPLARTDEGTKLDVVHATETLTGEQDLNSFMYQTVGHTVIPLYEQALGIPLYRQEIRGTAVQTGTNYSHAASDITGSGLETKRKQAEVIDETESLMPLLKTIMRDHPSVNAVSTGAILSTYQRTRIESVALRLGLTPLSYLWKYPILPPGVQASLLQDMQDVRLDARIIKVASGGLDESFLWENVGSTSVIGRIEKSMRRFGTYGDGSVLGEGGEFETLVVDGPDSLFKGRIEVPEENRRVVREGGGSAWLSMSNATVVMKDTVTVNEVGCRVPDLLESKFYRYLHMMSMTTDVPVTSAFDSLPGQLQTKPLALNHKVETLLHWTFCSEGASSRNDICKEASEVIRAVHQRLTKSSLDAASIISTVVILRSMDDFAKVNKVSLS